MPNNNPETSTDESKKKSTHWVLALQLYHAIKIDEANNTANANHTGQSILDELREIGEDNHISNGGPMCGSEPPENARNSWIIPARGTPEYKDVLYIMNSLKNNANLENDARELIRLRAFNQQSLREIEKNTVTL